MVQQALVEDGVELFAGTALKEVRQDRRGFTVRFIHDGKLVTRRASHLFNALGREPNTAVLGLAAAGVNDPGRRPDRDQPLATDQRPAHLRRRRLLGPA